jgi:hypothetical protein
MRRFQPSSEPCKSYRARMIGRSAAASRAWIGFQFALLLMLGCGAWTARAADMSGEKALFEENFTDAPGKGWSWLRELPDHWKIDKERKELLISPVWSEGNMKNIPLWTVADVKTGPLAIEVHVEHAPTGDYEYAGLIWYFDDKNFVAIRKGPHGEDGKILSLVRRKAGNGDGPPSAPKNVVFNEPGVDLRMVIAGGRPRDGIGHPARTSGNRSAKWSCRATARPRSAFAPATGMDPSRVGRGSASSASCNSTGEDDRHDPPVKQEQVRAYGSSGPRRLLVISRFFSTRHCEKVKTTYG